MQSKHVSLLLLAVTACTKTPPTTHASNANSGHPQAGSEVGGTTDDDVELPRVPAHALELSGAPASASATTTAPAGASSAAATEAGAPTAGGPPPVGAELSTQPPDAAANAATDATNATTKATAATTAATTESTASGYPVPNIPVEYLSLPNGLRVVVTPDESAPDVTVQVTYGVGSRDEGPGKAGLARLVSYLMFQGSKHATGPALPRFEKAGANLGRRGADGRVDQDRTVFFATVPATSLEYVLWLEADRMGFSAETLEQAAFDQQREALLADLSQASDRPFGVQSELIARYLYPEGHPYAHTPEGRDTDLKALTLSDAKAWMQRWFTPNNAILTVAGRLDIAATKSLIARYFADLAPGAGRVRATVVSASLASDVVVHQLGPIPQPKVSFAWHSAAALTTDDAALALAARVLTDGSNALLTRRLIAANLATQVAAVQASHDLTGAFVVEALATDEAAIPKIEAEIIAVMQSLSKDGPSDSDLDGAKASAELQMFTELERMAGPGSRSERMSLYASLLGDPRALPSDHARLMTLSRSDIGAAVGRWLADKPKLTLRYLRDGGQAVAVDGVDRSVEPTLSGQLPSDVPGFVSKTLANGLTLHVVTRAGMPKVETALIIKSGDLNETDANAGLSMLAAVAAERGTRTRTRAEIETQLHALGTQLTTQGSKLGSAVAASVLKRHLDAATELIADIVRNPSFPEADVASLRELQTAQLKRAKADAQAVAADVLPRILYAGGHPLGIPDHGLEASLSKLTAADLVTHHASYWVPNNAAWLVVGDVTLAEVEALAAKHFGSWVSRPLPANATAEGSSPGGNYVFLIDAPGIDQALVRVAAVAPNSAAPENAALQIANHVLGGSYESRMVAELRKAKVQAASVFAQLNQNRLGGYWLTAATVAATDTPATLTAIRKAVEGLAFSGPDGSTPTFTADEVEDAKRTLSKAFLSGFATQAEILQQTAPVVLEGRDATSLTKYLDLLLAETPASVGAVAKQYFTPNRMIALVIGDAKQLEAPLAALHWGETVVLTPEGDVVRQAAAQNAVADTASTPNSGAGLPAQPETNGAGLPAQPETNGAGLPAQPETNGAGLPAQPETNSAGLPAQPDAANAANAAPQPTAPQ